MRDDYCSDDPMPTIAKIQCCMDYIAAYLIVLPFIVMFFKKMEDRHSMFFLSFALLFGVIIAIIFECMMTYKVGWVLGRKNCDSYNWLPPAAEFINHVILD